MIIKGLQKLTLLDYPGRVACTVFTGGCNFRCPFCHNGGLVLSPEEYPDIAEETLFDLLKKRRGVLEGVCITGGEPTLCPGLEELMGRIKELGCLVKLDTNGGNPDILRRIIQRGLADYIAMDIKNALPKYPETIGIPAYDTSKIRESIGIIMGSGIEYEFRTTVVRELHTAEDIRAIGESIVGAGRYFLQSYKESDDVIEKRFTAHSPEVLREMLKIAKEYVSSAELRGV